jgi:hypothetical protein
VTWRLPFGVGAIDLRYFRDWRREASTAAVPRLLAVELERPADDGPPQSDEAIRQRLDDVSWTIERLWLATAEVANSISVGADHNHIRLASTGGPPQAFIDRIDAPPSAPVRAPTARGLLLLRPDGATMLDTGLAAHERAALDLAAESEWLIAADVSRVLAAHGTQVSAAGASRLLDRMRAAGAIHPALRQDSEPNLPQRTAGDTRPFRLHRSALYAAVAETARTLHTRNEQSKFAFRYSLARSLREATWASKLRGRLRAAGLLTV